MKALPFIAILASLAIFSCKEPNSGKNAVTFLVSETKTAKTLSTADKLPIITTGDCKDLIIIQDVDTALYVLGKNDCATPLCDAVYHDSKIPWGAGKTMVAVKGGQVYLFTIIQDGDAGTLRLTKTILPRDAAASLVGNADGSFDVRGLKTEDGTSHDFNSND
jgi:hypothetical protein